MAGIFPYQAVNRLAFCCPYPAEMRNSEFCRNYTLKVNGKGIVFAVPNKAIAVLGVTTEKIQLEAAQRENAEKTAAVISALLMSGVLRKDIQTQSYQIQPQYDYVEGKQVFRGYLVTHDLKVEINQIDMTGKIIDTAVAAGANTVSGIVFTVNDPSEYYKAAMNAALNDAMEKAAVVGRKLNVNVSQVPIRIAEETYHTGTPIPYTSVQSTGTPTPVMPGQIEITAYLEVLFAYGGQIGFPNM